MTFYYVEESTLVGESQSQSADFGQSELTVLRENHVMYYVHSLCTASDYESIQLGNIKHVQTSHVVYNL